MFNSSVDNDAIKRMTHWGKGEHYLFAYTFESRSKNGTDWSTFMETGGKFVAHCGWIVNTTKYHFRNLCYSVCCLPILLIEWMHFPLVSSVLCVFCLSGLEGKQLTVFARNVLVNMPQKMWTSFLPDIFTFTLSYILIIQHARKTLNYLGLVLLIWL